MRFMVIVPASPESEAGILPDPQVFEHMIRFNEEMAKAGVMLAGEGLHPTSKGGRLKFSGGKCTVIDGPFAETKELIAGFWLIQAGSKEEAIAWMKRSPFGGGAVLEIRQLYEMDELGLTPELRERDLRSKDEAAQNARREPAEGAGQKHGQVCYLQIPAADPVKSAEFYEKIFGWRIEPPSSSFEAPGLIGQWVTDRPPAHAGGVLLWINVENIDDVLAKVRASGGEVIDGLSPDGPRWLATIRDPAGNAIGIAQHGPRSGSAPE
jgi:predicted enzyme related to lactoylglutathione lyase